jgi:hypothetical protein
MDSILTAGKLRGHRYQLPLTVASEGRENHDIIKHPNCFLRFVGLLYFTLAHGVRAKDTQMFILVSGLLFAVGIILLFLSLLGMMLNIFLYALAGVIWGIIQLIKPKEPEVQIIDSHEELGPMWDITPRSRRLS